MEEHIKTPVKKDALAVSDGEKITRIADYFKGIMETLGLDLEDDSLKGTPERVAKMYVDDLFYGLNPDKKPSLTLFENKYDYKGILVEKNIQINSTCEHHFMPIIGKVHVGYISGGKIVGLSKIHRIVDFCARQPQVQERLAFQIVASLKEALETDDIAVIIDAQHLCISTRGSKDHESSTVTMKFSGKFEQDQKIKNEFLSYLNS